MKKIITAEYRSDLITSVTTFIENNTEAYTRNKAIIIEIVDASE